MKLIDGRVIAATARERLRGDATSLRTQGVEPRLQVIQPEGDGAAASYVRGLERAAADTLVDVVITQFPADGAKEELFAIIDRAANDPTVHGILLLTPLPTGCDLAEAGARIPMNKDIDGINPTSAGRLSLGLPAFAPATASAVLDALTEASIDVTGQHVVIIGRSATVGKPVAFLLLKRHATVTICHSRTVDLPSIARTADILIVAIGKAKFVNASFVKPGAVVIDVGINQTDQGLVGDVDAQSIEDVASAMTPVPGGIGPITNVMLLSNTLEAARLASDISKG